jgi:methyl-accepting chemotaxis protein
MAEQRPNGGVFVEFQPMSPEEIQRTVQFLLHQQAQFAADSAASRARFDARFEKISGHVETLSASTEQLSANLEKLTATTGQVANGLIGLTAVVGHVVGSVSQLADVQTRTNEQILATDERLNLVIQMFERHLRDDHGHRPS